MIGPNKIVSQAASCSLLPNCCSLLTPELGQLMEEVIVQLKDAAAIGAPGAAPPADADTAAAAIQELGAALAKSDVFIQLVTSLLGWR